MRIHIAFASAAALTALGFSAGMSPATAGYSFTTINSTGGDGDFTQLLGINSAGTIAGYFGDGTVVPNNGFTIAPPYGPGNFTAENFPGAAQTQVVGLNNGGWTVGFYVDAGGDNIGFAKMGASAPVSVVDPNTGTTAPTFNQLLGVNDNGVAAGVYVDGSGVAQGYIVNLTTDTFATITLPSSFNSVSTTATGINNSGVISGFFTDSATDSVDGFLDKGGAFSILSFGADTNTMAFGLNNENQVVGSYVDSMGDTHGFVFNWVTASLTTINDPNADGTTSFGVEGTIVNGINDAGQLVGFYANTSVAPDAVNGFLANPVPEPSTWAMMMAGFAGLGLFGYRANRRRALPRTAAARA